MKKILCFGDSNTFGFVPETGKRYDKNTRWTGVLQNLGKSNFEITEAGCNNRTCICDNPSGAMFTGYKILPQLLNKDFDCVILAIGINDLQFLFDATLNDLKIGMENLIKITQDKLPNAKILIVAPAKLSEDVLKGYFSCQFNESSIEKSLGISELYENVAKSKNCEFLDLDKVAKPSPRDGLHYEPEGHQKIANAMFEKIQETFSIPQK